MYNIVMKKESVDLNFYKLVWIFTIGAVIGWGVELFVYWFKYDNFMYFQGLVYGPFQLIYGIGALILALIFIFCRKMNFFLIFLIGFVVFTIFEYIGSWIQEFLFGSFTWNYTNFFRITLNGRVNLLYCVLFGLLTVIWVKFVHEKLLILLDKFRGRIFKVITIIFAVFLTVNIILTCMATARLVDRHNEIAPRNSFERFIDKHYDDEFMKKWLPKVRVIRND